MPRTFARQLAGSSLAMRKFTVIAIFVAGSAIAANRDPQERAAFMQQHPCPATGKTYGHCPGYIVDHVVPLACGGADKPENMQWQTVAESCEKDKWELSLCGKQYLYRPGAQCR